MVITWLTLALLYPLEDQGEHMSTTPNMGEINLLIELNCLKCFNGLSDTSQ